MTEQSPVYSAGSPANLNVFKHRRCALPYSNPQYEAPTPAEVDQLIKLAGWSQRQAAELVGVNFSAKGSTTIRKWRTAQDKPEHRPIPYAAWRLMLLSAGVVELGDQQPLNAAADASGCGK